jgi:hypothetical protein
MACCGQSGADRFSTGEIEDRRAARAAAVGDRDRDPARAPGSDGLGGVLWKDGRPPILGEQPAGRATNGDAPFPGRQFALQHRHRLRHSRQVPYARTESSVPALLQRNVDTAGAPSGTGAMGPRQPCSADYRSQNAP